MAPAFQSASIYRAAVPLSCGASEEDGGENQGRSRADAKEDEHGDDSSSPHPPLLPAQSRMTPLFLPTPVWGHCSVSPELGVPSAIRTSSLDGPRGAVGRPPSVHLSSSTRWPIENHRGGGTEAGGGQAQGSSPPAHRAPESCSASVRKSTRYKAGPVQALWGPRGLPRSSLDDPLALQDLVPLPSSREPSLMTLAGRSVLTGTSPG